MCFIVNYFEAHPSVCLSEPVCVQLNNLEAQLTNPFVVEQNYTLKTTSFMHVAGVTCDQVLKLESPES